MQRKEEFQEEKNAKKLREGLLNMFNSLDDQRNSAELAGDMIDLTAQNDDRQ